MTADFSARPHAVLGNPENRRVKFFQAAAMRVGLPAVDVVSYLEFLRDPDQCLARFEGQRLKIDSPGENFDVERRLIATGATAEKEIGAASHITAEQSLRLCEDHGRIRYVRQRFLGFHILLCQLGDFKSKIDFYNDPADIALMFNKRDCQIQLAQIGIPVPELMSPVNSFDELETEIRARGWRRVFIKPNHGSSASGVIALQLDSMQRFRLVTPIELERDNGRVRLYNNLKLQTFNQIRDIVDVVNAVLSEGALVERWLPKASIGRRVFDLRVVVIGGRAQHVVARTSTGPLTNLHLGNRRGNLGEIRDAMGDSKWADAMATAEQVSLQFEKSVCFGVDLLLHPGFRDPTVIEVNAFGDLLPGVLHQGMDTYESQIQAVLSRQ